MSDSSGQTRRPRPRTAADNGASSHSASSHSKHSVSVDRGFAILERFSGERGSESVADISDSIGLPRSSVHRYLQTLVALGLVEQRGTPRRRYRLTAGAAAPGIAAIAATGLPSIAHRELTALRRDSSCTARLAIRIELDALLIDLAPSFAAGQGELALAERPGARLPGERSAAGRVLLAAVDVDALPRGLQERARAARAGLESVRTRGWASEAGERADGAYALAVPIALGRGDALAALELIGCAPEVTLEALTRHLGDLQAAAQRLAAPIAALPWAQWRPYRRQRRR
jgi:DNA-binding IclR family transcriptional regulator